MLLKLVACAFKGTREISGKEANLVRGVVNDEIHDKLHSPVMSLLNESLNICHGSIRGVNVSVIRYIISLSAHSLLDLLQHLSRSLTIST
jgi:hypothetical protein